MDKLRIFNIALSVFNAELLTEEDLENTEGHPEVKTLELFLPTAIMYVQRERDWTFLEEKLDLGEDGGAIDGYSHSYTLPSGLFRLTRADGIYRVVGDKLLTNGAPIAYGIMQTLPGKGVPEDFYELVAFALAVCVAQKMSPGDTKAQTALSIYTFFRDRMVMNDVQCQMRERREEANGDGSYV